MLNRNRLFGLLVMCVALGLASACDHGAGNGRGSSTRRSGGPEESKRNGASEEEERGEGPGEDGDEGHGGEEEVVSIVLIPRDLPDDLQTHDAKTDDPRLRELRYLVGRLALSDSSTYWIELKAPLDDNRLHAWGDNADGLLGNVTSNKNDLGPHFAQVSAGAKHFCAIRKHADQTELMCGGSNDERQLGKAKAAQREMLPVIVSKFEIEARGIGEQLKKKAGRSIAAKREILWEQIVASAYHNFALGTPKDGLQGLFFWGKFAGKTKKHPTLMPFGSDFANISSCASHTCGIKNDGKLFGWGSNLNGQLQTLTATSTKIATPEAMQPALNFVMVAVGSTAETKAKGSPPVPAAGFTVALSDRGELWSAGANDQGQTIHPKGTVVSGLKKVVLPSKIGKVKFVSAGPDYVLVLAEDGKLYPFGNPAGPLGLGNNGPQDLGSPKHIKAKLIVNIRTATGVKPEEKEIEHWLVAKAGAYHACAVPDVDDIKDVAEIQFPVMCWGKNDKGQVNGAPNASLVLAPELAYSPTQFAHP